MDTIQPALPALRTWRLGFVATMGRGIVVGAVVGWVWAILASAIFVSFDPAAVLSFLSTIIVILSYVSLVTGAIVGTVAAFALWVVFTVLPYQWLHNRTLAGGIVGFVVCAAISAYIFVQMYGLPRPGVPLEGGGILEWLVFVFPCFLSAIVGALFAHRYYTVSPVFNPWPLNQSARTQ